MGNLSNANRDALDVHPKHMPALQPKNGSAAYAMGTELRAIGDALEAVPDATDLATALTLVNAIKAALVTAFTD